MKKKSLVTILSLLLIALLDESCKQESITPSMKYDLSVLNTRSTESCAADLGNVQLVNGMLCFSDTNHFRRVYECLIEQVERHNDNFESIYGNYSDKAVEQIIDSIGFDEDQPLIDFEQSHGFTSLRKVVEQQVEVWLENSVLNWNSDPEDATPVMEEELRTLLNPNHLVKIGEIVFDFSVPYGGDLEQLSGEPEVASRTGCFVWQEAKNIGTFDNGNRQFKTKVSLRNHGIKSKAKGKIVSYKRKSNGNWDKSRTKLSIALGGSAFDNTFSCEGSAAPFGSSNGPKRRKKLKAKFNLWGESMSSQCGFISASGLLVDFNLPTFVGI